MARHVRPCVPYVPESQFADAAEGLRYAVHLQRDGVVADRLYKRLASRTDELISIKEVEASSSAGGERSKWHAV